MLDAMRNNARSSLITLIFGAIIVTFIFSFGRGSSGFRSKTGETWAAKVNGDLVTATDFRQAYSNRYRQAAAARGGKYTAEQARADGLPKEALKGLEDQELIAQQAQELGIVVTDNELSDAIAKSPQFQQEGKFDFDYYKRLIENGYGMSVPRFEDAYRRDLLRSKVIEAALAASVVADDEVKAFYQAQHESAAMTFVKFTGFMFRDQAKASDAEVDAYVAAHQKELTDAYEKDKDTRWTEGESVKVRAITVSLAPTATPEETNAASARIDAALKEVKAGKDFAEVAKEKSEDSTTKLQGGDLGFIARGASAYGHTLEEAALKLKPDEVSPVIKDRTGFHILKAGERKPAHVKPLAEVQKQIAQDQLRNQKTVEVAKQKAAEALAQVKAGKSLKDLFPAKASEPGKFDIASFTTPQATETEPFHPMGGYIPGIGLAPKLSSAVFALTAPGQTPEAPIEDGDVVYVVQLKSRERADLSKLDDAEKKTVRERLEGQKKGELYQGWLDRLRKGARIVENDSLLAGGEERFGESYTPED